MKKVIFGLSLLVLSIAASAQQAVKPILKIKSDSYSVDEFKYVYQKNNKLSQESLSPEKYLDLFVNYKLKVTEAHALGYDTIPTFVKEFEYYRNELAKPYLTDKHAEETVALEAYERLKYEVDASHILIRFPPTPSPEDTIKAYQKIVDIKSKIDTGMSFADAASQFSEDPSANRNSGRLGYFSGFQMVYPFESAAFNTPIGKMSPITRTNFGYHLIFVHGKRPAKGEILASHIMKAFPSNSPPQVVDAAKASIDSIYARILAGESFEQLATEKSDDRNSAVNGGELAWFGTGRMIPEFAEPAFTLKENGDISKPIQTPFGWHIIKRKEYKPVQSYDELKTEINERIASDDRSYAGQDSLIKKLKSEYQYKSMDAQLQPLKSLTKEAGMTDSLFFAKLSDKNELLAQFSNQNLTQGDFIKYLKDQSYFSVQKGSSEIDFQFNNFVKNKLIEFEKTQLPIKYLEYKYLVNEYHDGLLIFEISQTHIWDKAANDSIGLANYYTANLSKYKSPAHIKGMIVSSKDQALLAKLKSLLTEDNSDKNDSIITALDTNKTIEVEHGQFKKGDNAVVDLTYFGEKTEKTPSNAGYSEKFAIGQFIPEKTSELSEIRGQILSDYQNKLEQEWIIELRKKYQPKANYKLAKKIK